jgi:hypothetical protein
MSTHFDTAPKAAQQPGWYSPASCSVDEFRQIVETTTRSADYPWADDVIDNVLIYGQRISEGLRGQETRREI